MHLLFLSSLLPEPVPSTGFAIATQAVIDGYRRLGVRLTVAGFRTPRHAAPVSGEIALGELEIENSRAGAAQKAQWVAEAMLRGLPVSAAKLKHLSDARLASLLDAAGPFDAIVLNSIQMPTAYPFLAGKAPAIFVAHNVEHCSARENAAAATSLANQILYRREARLLARAEARLCRMATVVHTLTEADRDGLGLSGAAKALPLALSVGRRPVGPDDGSRTHDIGMIGTWSWAPNRVGLDWFVGQVAPLLPPGVTVAIAGRFDGPPPPAPPCVRYCGRVEDAQGFVRASRVVALATKGGTGVQLKTIETFEEGMPAVATPAALRGIDRLPPNVEVADDPKTFAAALARMIEADRAGTLARADGTDFAAKQTRALDAALAQGLGVLAAAGARRSAASSAAGPFAADGCFDPADVGVARAGG